MALGKLLRRWAVAAKQHAARDVAAAGWSPLRLPLPTGSHAPPPWFHVRGHQFTDYGFAFTPWPSAAQAYLADLVAFGTNQLELAHIDWARGDLAKMVTYADMAAQLSINISVWYPINMYTSGPLASKATEKMFASMSRFDSLFVPGGDGGEVLAPAAFVATVQNLTAVMRRYHPNASVWMSAQDYSMANLTAFMAAVSQPGVSTWLTGIVYGPHVHVPLTQFLDMAPAGTRVRQYPDLCHLTQSQFEAPRWDPAFTLTYRRLAISPSPRRFYNILTLRTNATYVAHSAPGGSGGHLIGFGAYSEGTSDDLNKVLWSHVASAPDATALSTTVREYADYFFHADAAAPIAAALFGLEDSWRGPLAARPAAVPRTLALLRAAYAATPPAERATNWRLLMYMLRGYFDAAVSTRLGWERATEAQVHAVLAGASAGAPAAAIAAALRIIASRATQLDADSAFRAANVAVREMAAAINASVTAFVVADQQPGLSLNTLNASISDVGFLRARLQAASALPTAAAQQAALDALLQSGTAPPGGFYDRLGSVDAADHPHLVIGEGVQADPSFYFTSLQGADTATDALGAADVPPMAHRTYSLSFFDAPLTLKYTRLPTAGLSSYNLTVLFWSPLPSSGKAPQVVRLVANGDTIMPYRATPAPMAPLSWTIPIASIAKAGDALTLSCNQPPGLSGSGRGCYVSEVVLTPTAVTSVSGSVDGL